MSKRRPLLPPAFVRAVLSGHSLLGLSFAAVIYIVCLTGTLAVLERELEQWEQPDVPAMTQASGQAVRNALGQAMARARGPVEHAYVYLPEPALPRLSVVIDDERGDTTWIADDKGDLKALAAHPWTEFLAQLHVNLHLPRSWGGFIVGLTGVALLSSLISGILAHPRVLKDAFHFRRGGSLRLQEADLHNRLGVWALPFHVVVSLTGALLGLTTIIVGVLALAVFQGDVSKAYALFMPPEPVRNQAPAPVPDVARALAETRRIAPASIPRFIGLEHPGERGAGILVYGLTPRNLGARDTFLFDREGTLIQARPAAASSVGEAIIGALGYLHFGWFGGLPLKIAYMLLGFSLTAVTSSGVTIWLARRRDKGRPAPHWERIWATLVWGQPLLLSLTALAALAMPVLAEGRLLIALWLGGTLLCPLAALLPTEPARIAARLRRGTAILLVLIALLHLVSFGWSGLVAIGLDALLVIAALLLAFGLPGLRAPRGAGASRFAGLRRTGEPAA